MFAAARRCLTSAALRGPQAPFGEVVSGMEVLEVLEPTGPMEDGGDEMAEKHGNAYFDKRYPDLAYIHKARIYSEDKKEL